jgi:hypothetical protein
MLAGYSVSMGADNRAGAEALARFLTRADTVGEIARATGYLPPLRALTAEQLWPGDAARATMLAEIPYVRLDPQHRFAHSLSKYLAEEGQAALLDRKSPAVALADAAKRLEEEMASQRLG